MPAYRLYHTDGIGHIRSAEIVVARSEDDAVVAAKESLKGHSGELWHEGKMICRIGSPEERS